VLSAIPMPTICESYVRAKALHHLDNGRVVICAGGYRQPVLHDRHDGGVRAIEMNCDAVAKATQVDGVYSADPRVDPSAERYDVDLRRMCWRDDLKVMDGAAIALDSGQRSSGNCFLDRGVG